MGRLDGKVAVVIGGLDGIGGAVARRFADEGAQVYATSRRAENSDRGALRAERVDATDLEAVGRLLARIGREEGRIDILCLSAGLSDFAGLEDTTEEHFDRTFALNVRSLVFATRNAVAVMPGGGAVVLIGSIAASIGTKGHGAYGASKAAVRSFTRTWANELAPRGIRVNVVAPGPTDTAMFSATSPEVRQTLTGLIPLGRMGRPEEVAAAALFLASDESSFVTGVELPVDGGMAQV